MEFHKYDNNAQYIFNQNSRKGEWRQWRKIKIRIIAKDFPEVMEYTNSFIKETQ